MKDTAEPAAPETRARPPTADDGSLARQPKKPPQFLRQAGDRIVDEDGNTVIFRGCNVGGWLLIEPWIPGLDHQGGFETEKEMWDILGKRFGEERKLDLIRTYRRSFFTEADVKRIAELGMNSIRLPIWWRTLTDPDYGGDIAYLDDCIRWCRDAGIYVIIDLQGAPGGQAAESSNVGEPAHGGLLWKEAANQDMTVEWWAWIAARYRDEPAVAAYDLLNEGTSMSRYEDLVNLYDRMYRAVREADPRHLIIIEDVWGFHRLPRAEDMGWSNVAYSFHVYARETTDGWNGAIRWFPAFNRTALYHGLPIYVGEFNTIQLRNGGTDAFLLWRDVCEYYGWSWSFWTWKKVADDMSINWGLTGYYDAPPVPNLNTDSFEHIKSCFERLESSHARENPMLVAALQAPSRWKPEADIAKPAPGAKLLTLRTAYVLAGADDSIIAEWGHSVPNIGYWKKNDTVAWRFEVERDGVYEIGLRMANDADGNAAAIWIDGVKAKSAALPNTRGWRNFRDVVAGRFQLRAGAHTIELGQADASDSFINLQYVSVAPSSEPAEAADESEVRLIPATMLPLPERSPIRVEWQSNPPNIANWDPGQSVSWRVPLARPRRFTVEAVYATPNEESSLRITIDGKEACGGPIAPSPGWQEYATATLGVIELPAGEHEITATWRLPRRTHAGNLRLIRLVEAVAPL